MSYSPFVNAPTLRKVRLRMSKTQTQFGQLFGVTKRTIIRWGETGVRIDRFGNYADVWLNLCEKYPDEIPEDERIDP